MVQCHRQWVRMRRPKEEKNGGAKYRSAESATATETGDRFLAGTNQRLQS